MDQLIELLSEVSSKLMPILGLVCLILLAMVLYRVYLLVKRLPDTLNGVDKTVTSVNDKIDKLEQPLDTLRNVSKTVDAVNNSAVGAATQIIKYTADHSEAIVDSVRSYVDKRRSPKKDSAQQEMRDETVDDSAVSEEDFGIYE